MDALVLTRVAIADDEPLIQRMLEKALGSAGYLCVGLANDGQEAIDLVQKKKPQLILLDIHMPGMDGLEATRQIVKLETTAVVLLTGDSDPNLPRQAMSLGAHGYMQKPFEISHLISLAESAWHAFQNGRVLESKIRELNETLENRKLLEKAKGILMEQQNFTEDAAHKMLQKISQDQGISLKEVCRSIIQVKMVLGKSALRKAA